MGSDRRILVLGSSPHTRLVDAYTWDELPESLNVADYDVVILNFTPFTDHEFAQGINIDTIPSFEQFARLLFSPNSEIIVIGSPDFYIGSNPYANSTWWLPVNPRFVYNTGKKIQNIDPDYAYYLEYVHHWTFFFDGWEEPHSEFLRDYLGIGVPRAHGIIPQIAVIAETRFNRPIAFEISYETYHCADSEKGRLLARAMEVDAIDRLGSSGKVIWLPSPTEISPYEAIDLLLRERYEIRSERIPPDFCRGYALPKWRPIQEKIAQLENQIAVLNEELTIARQEFDHERRFLKLLYEQGEEVLEPVVRDALRELGAEVEDPKQRGHEDGRLVDPLGRNAMLEIKGRTGTLRLRDVRELDQWVRDAVAKESWESKGILIGDLRCEEPPEQRVDLFPPNCVEAARNFDICLMTTTQLFLALQKHQQGQLNIQEFWDEIFKTKGVCQLSELECSQ